MPGQIYTKQNDFPSGKFTLAIQITFSIRKNQSLCSKAKHTNKAELWAKYKLCKWQTQRAIMSVRWSFLKKNFLNP